MNFKEYADKVRACWLGKNIGGTLGCPLEGRRDVFDLDFYVHDIRTGSLPNDDLDLQLVWLLAAEAHGQAVNSEILSEFWLTYIPCDWSEYGAGKNNMRFGLIPPRNRKPQESLPQQQRLFYSQRDLGMLSARKSANGSQVCF